MAQIQVSSVKNQVFQIIKDRIIEQEYKMGQKISIASLVDELKVSNTPVREALNMLVETGLVVETPNAGFAVFQMTEALAAQLHQGLLALTIGALTVCANEGLLDELARTMEICLELADKPGDNLAVASAAADFDCSFFNTIDNKLLLDTYAKYSDILLIGVVADYQRNPDNVGLRNRQHRQIYEAVKAHDVPRATELLCEHWAYFVKAE